MPPELESVADRRSSSRWPAPTISKQRLATRGHRVRSSGRFAASGVPARKTRSLRASKRCACRRFTRIGATTSATARWFVFPRATSTRERGPWAAPPSRSLEELGYSIGGNRRADFASRAVRAYASARVTYSVKLAFGGCTRVAASPDVSPESAAAPGAGCRRRPRGLKPLTRAHWERWSSSANLAIAAPRRWPVPPAAWAAFLEQPMPTRCRRAWTWRSVRTRSCSLDTSGDGGRDRSVHAAACRWCRLSRVGRGRERRACCASRSTGRVIGATTCFFSGMGDPVSWSIKSELAGLGGTRGVVGTSGRGTTGRRRCTRTDGFVGLTRR